MAAVAGRFDGQVAVVTGGAQGLGLATAELLAAEGAAVVLVDIDGERAEASAESIRQGGGDADAHAVDLTKEEAVAGLFERLLERRRQLDILVNLAGIYPWGTLEETSLETWHAVLAVNLDGTFLCCRAALPHMKERGYGRIVNVSSGTVVVGLGGLPAYVASKAGVIGLTRSIAREAGPHGVTANVMMPGLIATEHVLTMLDDEAATDAFFDETIAQQCVKRRGLPEDIAHGIAFLASREASFVTGHTLYVGGGYGFV
jgi:3-oxoacyl-[acyl-carrier protein] reductase